MSRRAGVVALLVAASLSNPLHAAVQVIVGSTPIPDGEAVATHDITVFNEKLAFAIAVDTSVPYGVPRGAIIDVAPVMDGRPGRDRVVFADFIPNNWSAWPNTYQKVDIVERGPQQAVIKATRDWGKVTIATKYTLRANADRIEMQTTMTNTGDTALTGLLSGQTLWPSAGYFFGVPGLGSLQEGKSARALTDRSVPTTQTGPSRCTRLTLISSARARKTCCCSTRSGRASRARSTPGCRSAREAISVRCWLQRSSASRSRPAPCRAWCLHGTARPSTNP